MVYGGDVFREEFRFTFIKLKCVFIFAMCYSVGKGVHVVTSFSIVSSFRKHKEEHGG